MSLWQVTGRHRMQFGTTRARPGSSVRLLDAQNGLGCRFRGFLSVRAYPLTVFQYRVNPLDGLTQFNAR